MKRWCMVIVAGLLGTCLAGQAQAQQRPRTGPTTAGPRSPVSPYLNLSRGGNPSLNYYNLVRPQLDTARNLQDLQLEMDAQHQQTLQLQQQELTRATGEQNITGHPVRFYSMGPYFTYNPTRVTMPRPQR